MARVVFFGLDGAFSTVALEGLVQAGLAPSLVIHGRERSPGAPELRHWPPQPNPLQRFLQGTEQLLGRGVSPHESSLTRAAHAQGIEVYSTTRAHHPGLVTALTKRAPEILVVAGFSHLLSPAVLATASHGGLNLHPGYLPSERGPAPVYWALRAGRTRFGWTVHQLDAHEDSGPIVTAGEVEAPRGIDGQALHRQLSEAGTPALIEAVQALLEGRLIATPQTTEGSGRCPRPTLADRRLDQTRSAAEVYTFAAGCAASYRLWAEVAGDRFFVARALSYDETASLGYDFVLLNDRLLLGCQPGVVELELAADGAVFSAEYSE